MSVRAVMLHGVLERAEGVVNEAYNHPVVVGNRTTLKLCDPGETGIIAGCYRRTAARSRWIGTKTMCVRVRVGERFVDAAISEITDRQCRGRTDVLLHLQV